LNVRRKFPLEGKREITPQLLHGAVKAICWRIELTRQFKK
jgi:hypothetical protein